MVEERTQRRLAAILAADVVGFSRLMEADESGTMAALKVRRKDVLDPLVAKHQGRIFKTTGDGLLIEFASAVNAVQCAVELQQGMAVANSGKPEDRHIVLRIGVNLGDVMVEGSDLYGEGVNIAARLETIAEPGGILVSSTAHDHVRTKVKVGFKHMGVQALKNIAQPVRAYRVTGTPTIEIAAPKSVSDKPSIAVLPFINMSGDPEQEYFSDGLTEDVITELSRFKNLLVIARNSSFTFKGQAVDVRKVASDLGVRYVLEGSVRKAGDRVRVTGQLIDATHGNHLWAERYDREIADIFELQDEITSRVIDSVSPQILLAEAARVRRKAPQSIEAWDLVMQALPYMWRMTTEDHSRAQDLLLEALAQDPEYAHAYALLG